jgi:hypothetical protein
LPKSLYKICKKLISKMEAFKLVEFRGPFGWVWGSCLI